jgi:hypothetical protein
VAFSLTNTPPVITLTPTTLPNGVKTVAYPATTLTAAGAGSTPPFAFAVTNGALPPGLTLDATTGILSGTPSMTGTFSFTVTATDVNGFTGSQPYTVTVLAAPLVGVTIVPAGGGSLTIRVGETVQLTAVATFADGSMQDVTAQAQWSATAPVVASVSGSGMVTGKTPGTAPMVATFDGMQGTAPVTVTPPILTGVQPAPAPASRPGAVSVPGTAPAPSVAPVPGSRSGSGTGSGGGTPPLLPSR